MRDPRIDKLARLLVHYSAKVQPGDLAMIHLYDPLAEPLGLAVYKEVLQAGAYGVFRVDPTASTEILLKYGSDELIEKPNPLNVWLMETIDVRFALRAASNTKRLTNVDPRKARLLKKSETPYWKVFMDRQSTGELRWALTEVPTEASAQEAGMSLSEYEDFVYGACMLHLDDPVAYWKQKSAEQQRLVEWLKGKDKVVVKAENVDLTLSIKDRVFINADGDNNMPDGEIFTGPVEDSMNGWVRFTYPAIYDGHEARDVELKFENGKVVKATASKGEDYLNSILDVDAGARWVGEFAIATNENIQQFTGNILYDEKIGGTFHIALGHGYPETGSVNESALHWDMICDMRSGGEIYVDDTLFYKDGEFQV
jgi:aminopeptidase